MDGRDEKFENLCNSIIRVRDVVLRPLQCFDGGMPSEIGVVVNALRS